MDNPPRPEQGFSNPGCQEPAVVDTYEAKIQTALNNLQYLMEKESHGNASQFTFDGSTDARAAMISTENGSNNISSSVHSQGSQFSPSVEDSSGLDKLGTSRNHSDTHGMAMNISYFTLSRNRSASNCIFMNETIPDRTKSKPKILDKSVEDLSVDSQQDKNYDDKLGSNSTNQIAFHNRAVAGIYGQNVESLDELSQIARKDNEQCNFSDVVASNSFSYSAGIFEASVSSGIHKVKNNLNVVGKMSQSFNKVEIKSTKYEEVKALISGSCKEEISQQVDENVLRYVDSLYYNLEGTDLLIHRSTHVPKTTCNICGKEHAVENLHKNEHSCPVPKCTMKFPCRTRLYQHIPEHRNYFRKHCWVCIRTFKEHITENDSTNYVCCVCGFQTKHLSSLESHNILLHLPRCFCKICEKEYHVDDNNFHGSEVKCFVCNYEFKCQLQLEHFESHVKYFSGLSRISESNKKESFFYCPFRGCFQTLSEFTFKDHIYKHAELAFFDCKTCGRRFSKLSSLNRHKTTCKALLYKCEICETRFFSFDLLHSHGLLKHKG